MIKYIVATALMFVSTTVTADPIQPGIAINTVTIDSVKDSDDDAHMVLIHKNKTTMELLMVGCPRPKTNSIFYMIGVPDVGVFAIDKDIMDSALGKANNDFGEASKAVMAAKQLCVLVGARKISDI